MGLYEQYTGETDTKAKGINSAFLGAFDNLDEDTKQSFIDAMEGAETGLSEKQDSLYSKASEISGSVINIFRKMFDEHSPSKVFKKSLPTPSKAVKTDLMPKLQNFISRLMMLLLPLPSVCRLVFQLTVLCLR